MIDKEIESSLLREFSMRLATLGLSLEYEALNWGKSLYLVFDKGLPSALDRRLSCIVRDMVRCNRDFLNAKRCEFVREEPDEGETLGEDGSDEEMPPDIAAQIAALPKFPIDEFYVKVDSGVPFIEFWVKPQFSSRSDEETAYDRREEERERLVELALVGSDGDDEDGDFTLLPIPPPSKTRNTEVFLTMAYEPYDDIENGEKVTEFREYKAYYVRKLLSQPLKTVRFQRGYGGPHHEPPRQMRWTIKNIEYYNHVTRKSCPIDKPTNGFKPTFIAIDLGDRVG